MKIPTSWEVLASGSIFLIGASIRSPHRCGPLSKQHSISRQIRHCTPRVASLLTEKETAINILVLNTTARA